MVLLLPMVGPEHRAISVRFESFESFLKGRMLRYFHTHKSDSRNPIYHISHISNAIHPHSLNHSITHTHTPTHARVYVGRYRYVDEGAIGFEYSKLTKKWNTIKSRRRGDASGSSRMPPGLLLLCYFSIITFLVHCCCLINFCLTSVGLICSLSGWSPGHTVHPAVDVKYSATSWFCCPSECVAS